MSKNANIKLDNNNSILNDVKDAFHMPSAIIIPMKHVITAVHMYAPTCSLNSLGARIIVKTGIVKLLMVAIVRVDVFNPAIHNIIAIKNNVPRTICSCMWCVRNVRPVINMNINIDIAPNNERKNAISTAGICTLINLDRASFALLHNKLNIKINMLIYLDFIAIHKF